MIGTLMGGCKAFPRHLAIEAEGNNEDLRIFFLLNQQIHIQQSLLCSLLILQHVSAL